MLRLLLRHTFTALLALVLLFEEWGWEPLAAWAAKLGRLRAFARIEARVVGLSPWAAVAVFAAPALLLLPLKVLAVFFLGRGHALMGLLVLLAAKVVGTALVARLFTLTQPALMRLAWFARWYPRWKAWKDRVMAQARASSWGQGAARHKAAAASHWADFRRRHGLRER